MKVLYRSSMPRETWSVLSDQVSTDQWEREKNARWSFQLYRTKNLRLSDKFLLGCNQNYTFCIYLLPNNGKKGTKTLDTWNLRQIRSKWEQKKSGRKERGRWIEYEGENKSQFYALHLDITITTYQGIDTLSRWQIQSKQDNYKSVIGSKRKTKCVWTFETGI